MNPYIKNLNKIEFTVTMACTGKSRHCSEGDHEGFTEHIDGKAAADDREGCFVNPGGRSCFEKKRIGIKNRLCFL